MRSGPKWEITYEMAVANVQTVAARLNVTRLSLRQYEAEGSFCADTLCRKFGWTALVTAAGLQPGLRQRPRNARRLCSQDCGRVSMAYPRWHLCRTCMQRIQRNESGAMELHEG